MLVDSNLLVLYIVGTVNTGRIAGFKRTAKYDEDDFRLLVALMARFTERYTLPQIMAEVSTLTDLRGAERRLARDLLRQTIREVTESPVSSRDASDHQLFAELGLTDAAIAHAAREHDCVVLTDDLPLWDRLLRIGVPAVNYTHLRIRFRSL